MLYTVKYKLKNHWFWKTVKKVKGDFIGQDVTGHPRIIIKENEERLEIPCNETQFWFSLERFLVIKQNMENESGQDIRVKK